MIGNPKESQIEELLSPVAKEQGVELVAVEYRREPLGWVVRIYIDSPGGVTLEDCERVSEEAGTLLDVEGTIPHRYRLEVSSPGPERPLKKRVDFDRSKGSAVRIKTREPIDHSRNFSGRLLEVADESLTVEVEGKGAVEIPWDLIMKANRTAS